MPRIDPNQTFDFVFDFDRDNPKPPTFKVRVLSARESLDISKRWDAREQANNAAEAESIALAVLESLVTGWDNIDEPFSKDAILNQMTMDELPELIKAAINPRLSASVKKKSE